MKRLAAALLLALLIFPTFAQQRRSANANDSWQRFYSSFLVAVRQRDHTAMLQAMPEDFFDGGGGLTAREWLQFIDENAKQGSWRDLRRSFSGGTVVNKSWSRNGVVTRVTRDGGYYFEYRRNGRWYFAGVVGD